MSTSLLTLIGPSASGKSTLARALADRGLVTVLPPGLLTQYGLDGLTGTALVIARADHVGVLRAAAGLTPLVYQVCAPIQQVVERLAERGLGPTERELRLAGFHAERVAGARISDRSFVNNGSISELIARSARRWPPISKPEETVSEFRLPPMPSPEPERTEPGLLVVTLAWLFVIAVVAVPCWFLWATYEMSQSWQALPY